MNIYAEPTISENVDLKTIQDCRTCLFDSTIAKIYSDGECEYCKLQTQLRESSKQEDWSPLLTQIKQKGVGKKYDCLVGISGGEDSSVLLYLAVAVWGLRPLVIHFNNRTNRPEATNNIKVITEHLNVNFIEYFVDKGEY
ncbi:MAG: phosphoadenosine phosphosulfate reductase family protein, partial [Bacteroidota bacterium]